MYRPWKVRGAYFNHSSKQLHRFPYVEKAHFCVSLSQEHRDLEWKCPIWSFKLTWKVTKWKTGSPVGLFPWCQLEISLQRGPHPSFRTDGKLSPSYQTSLISVPSEEGVHLNLTSRPETLCALWEWKKNKRHANRKKKAPQKVRNNQQVCDLLNNFRESVKKKLTQMLEQCKTFAIAFQPTRTEACHLFAFKKPHHVWLVPIASKVWF